MTLALARRAREGGSYHVRVSLCRSGMYMYKQGQLEYSNSNMDLSNEELNAIMQETEGDQGILKHLGPVLETGKSIAPFLKRNQLIILESSTYPGTTSEKLAKVLEQSGMTANVDFHIAYSPEREDPGNKDYGTDTIPKVVGADSQKALDLSSTLYKQVISSVTPVSNTRTAEAVKLTENIFRSVNIAYKLFIVNTSFLNY